MQPLATIDVAGSRSRIGSGVVVLATKRLLVRKIPSVDTVQDYVRLWPDLGGVFLVPHALFFFFRNQHEHHSFLSRKGEAKSTAAGAHGPQDTATSGPCSASCFMRPTRILDTHLERQTATSQTAKTPSESPLLISQQIGWKSSKAAWDYRQRTRSRWGYLAEQARLASAITPNQQ